jgi:hypothetical protein
VTIHIMGDIDDVFFPWADEAHRRSQLAGLHDGSAPWTSWHMWEDYGCSKEAWLDVMDQACIDGMYEDTPPFEGSVAAWNRLRWELDDVQLHLVTARGFMARAEEIREATPKWIEEYGIAHDTLTFAKDKVAAMRDLVPLREMDKWWHGSGRFDYAIDDGVHNYEALASAGVPVYLLTRPHNQNFPAQRRVESIEEFVDIVLKENA